ncbi:MAG: hypothetical protein K0S51_1248 [Bacillales bacterium]|jgi:hypothetical protein|nr:hypothetical protein [Bacillales bacterium]
MKNLLLITILFCSLSAANIENLDSKETQYAQYKKDDCGCKKP